MHVPIKTCDLRFSKLRAVCASRSFNGRPGGRHRLPPGGAAVVPVGCVRVAGRKSSAARTLPLPRRLRVVRMPDTHGMHRSCWFEGHGSRRPESMCRIAVLDFRSRRASTFVRGYARSRELRRTHRSLWRRRVGPLARPLPVRGRPVGMHQLCAQVLIAAILRPVIRADGMTPAGACREWPKLKSADDRRGCELTRRDRPVTRSVRTEARSSGARPGCRQTMPSARQFSTAATPVRSRRLRGGSRLRPAPLNCHFHRSERAVAHGTVSG
jgi:hypothetical protein